MTQPESHAGDYGWGLLILGIVSWDVLAPETLSHAGRRYMESPGWRFLYAGAIGAVALHLIDAYDHYGIPDPFKKALEFKHAPH